MQYELDIPILKNDWPDCKNFMEFEQNGRFKQWPVVSVKVQILVEIPFAMKTFIGPSGSIDGTVILKNFFLFDKVSVEARISVEVPFSVRTFIDRSLGIDGAALSNLKELLSVS